MEAAPPDRQSPDPAAPRGPDAPPLKGAPEPHLRRPFLSVLVLVASLLGLGVAAYFYRSYAAVHLRPMARMPRCVILVTRLLSKPSVASGSEAYPTPEGEVYLTPSEDRAVHCIEQRISKDLAVKFALAFTEPEPEIRGLELLKVLRGVPPDPSADREATAAYFIASSALRSLPDRPEIKAASDEVAELHACRFATRSKCPTRPGIPIQVWVSAIPSGAGLCVALFAFGRAGFRAARDRIRERRERRKKSRPAAAEKSD